MATNIGLVSLSQIQKLQINKNEPWEVQAFEEDRSNTTGATWPPRSYTCSFCGREFRSAQALGGHMNVHRRDRARLRLLNSSQVLDDASSAVPVFFSSSSEIAKSSGNGLFLFYPVQGAYGKELVDYFAASSFANGIDGRSICEKDYNGVVEELDLELRLGW